MKPVFSSNVNRVGYDHDTGELIVEWRSGKVSAYAGVTAAKADEVSKTVSVGNMIRDEIIGNYEHRYLANKGGG
jgi:hypothetical protein